MSESNVVGCQSTLVMQVYLRLKEEQDGINSMEVWQGMEGIYFKPICKQFGLKCF